MRAVIDKFMLEIRGKFRGEIVHLNDQAADASDQKIVAKHCGNRDAEGRHCGDESSRNTRRHRAEPYLEMTETA